MNESFLDILVLLKREIWEKRRLFALVYLFTSGVFLCVGWYWPKVYSSSSTILIDQQNILQPLMQGTAVTTDVLDRAKLAREIIFSRRVIDSVLEENGWLESNPTEVQKERIIASINDRTSVKSVGVNLIRITYDDDDPVRAFKVAQRFTEIFINQSLLAKQKESRDAFEFIDGQVREYHEKLQAAEVALKEFHSTNFDARPGSQSEVNARILELRRRMEATQGEIRELAIKRETLKKQLSGEAAITENLTREGQYRARLAALEDQLATLRLSYHDTYPDIVRIKTQMATIEKAINEESSGGASKTGEERDEISRAATTSLLYQELRSQSSAAETQMASLNARLEETQELLRKEEERIVRINDVEAKLSELTRDYEVNQDIYQSLLRQRENARITMNIDMEDQGLTFKIQEPAALQLTPQGIRFAHFLAAGSILSFAFPIGIIYGLTLLDQKVRSQRIVTEQLELPVLASVYHMDTPREYSLNSFKKSVILVAILISWAAYAYAAWLRVTG